MASTSSLSNSIAAELLSNMTKYGYKNMVPYINEGDAVGLETFKSLKLGQLFAVDTSRTCKNGRANPSHLFEIFGHFSGHEAMEVREVLLEHIARNLDFHVKCSIVCLEMRNTSFSNWVDRLADGRMYCDELGLLSLSALYRRHTLVVMANKLWSTIEHPTPVNLLELLNECSVKLIYLGQLRFRELKTHPRRPPRPIPIKSSTKKSTAEPAGQTTASTDTKAPTIVENSVTKGNALPVQTDNDDPHVETRNTLVSVTDTGHVETKLPDNSSGHVETLVPVMSTGHVETNPPVHSAGYVEMVSNDAEQVETSPARHVVMTDNPPCTIEKAVTQHLAGQKMDAEKTQEEKENTIPVTVLTNATAKNSPVHSLKGRTCTLKLKAISQLDIDVWCNKVTNYHRFNPLKPVEPPQNTEEDTGYSLRKCKSKADITGISIRTKNSVDYTPMMESGAEDEDDAPPRKQNKIWPHPAGPSQMVLRAHETINKNNKTKDFHTKPVTARPPRNEANKNSDGNENKQNLTNAKMNLWKQTKRPKLEQKMWKQMKRL